MPFVIDPEPLCTSKIRAQALNRRRSRKHFLEKKSKKLLHCGVSSLPDGSALLEFELLKYLEEKNELRRESLLLKTEDWQWN
ncbi:hypothetical protein TNCV_3780831 [Trichonephila clavipes]|nr:hypothetical protein TNCV_3780831 [Trichonephila clavipes]